jgi:hypothetical protein
MNQMAWTATRKGRGQTTAGARCHRTLDRVHGPERKCGNVTCGQTSHPVQRARALWCKLRRRHSAVTTSDICRRTRQERCSIPRDYLPQFTLGFAQHAPSIRARQPIHETSGIEDTERRGRLSRLLRSAEATKVIQEMVDGLLDFDHSQRVQYQSSRAAMICHTLQKPLNDRRRLQ